MSVRKTCKISLFQVFLRTTSYICPTVLYEHTRDRMSSAHNISFLKHFLSCWQGRSVCPQKRAKFHFFKCFYTLLRIFAKLFCVNKLEMECHQKIALVFKNLFLTLGRNKVSVRKTCKISLFQMFLSTASHIWRTVLHEQTRDGMSSSQYISSLDTFLNS